MKVNVYHTIDFFSAYSLLTGSEQKKTRETISSILNQNENAGLRLHKISHPSNKIFSYSINLDVRILSHQSSDNITLLYVGHHDDSYDWIRKRKFVEVEFNAIRIIEIKQEVEGVDNQLANDLHRVKVIDEELMRKLQEINNDDDIINFISEQTRDVQEQLLEIVSKKPSIYNVVPSHYIKVINDDNELESALKYPLELWRVFLHPAQEEIIQKEINESVYLTGCPGTGKTVCLIHKIKHFENQLNQHECVILTTFKKGLMDYLQRMLNLVDYDKSKTFIDDISNIKLHEGLIKNSAQIDGLFQIINSTLYYYKNGIKYKVKHLLFDEFQDFRNGQITVIKKLIQCTSFTLSFDYSQAIYRNVHNTIDELGVSADLVKLDFSYRINSKILNNLKQIVKIIRVLSNESSRLGNLGLLEIEEELIQNTRAAITGSSIIVDKYSNDTELSLMLLSDYECLLKAYNPDEIVVSRFFEDLYKHLTEDSNFHIEFVPKELKRSYKYAPTLKGMEYKAGLLILDETICQMLNMNRSIFIGRVDTGFLGGASNFRLNLNLLYVSLSRYRDYLKVYYPSKYEVIIRPIFEA